MTGNEPKHVAKASIGVGWRIWQPPDEAVVGQLLPRVSRSGRAGTERPRPARGARPPVPVEPAKRAYRSGSEQKVTPIPSAADVTMNVNDHLLDDAR